MNQTQVKNSEADKNKNNNPCFEPEITYIFSHIIGKNQFSHEKLVSYLVF